MIMKNKKPIGRPLMVEEIQLAKKLYNPPLISLDDVADMMSKKLKKRIHRTSVHRWVLTPIHKIRV